MTPWSWKPLLALIVGATALFSGLGFLIGLVMFIYGFWTYRKYRVLADLPESHIRGLAMGLVELHGKATGDPGFVAPFSLTPCLFYKATVEKENDKSGSKYLSFRTYSKEVPFHLQDETGKVLVDPKGAELDLEPTLRREIHVPTSAVAPAGTVLSDAELSGRLVDILKAELAQTVAELPPEQASYGKFVQSAMTFLGNFPYRGEFRLTEYCIVPGNEYDVTGTCVQNPNSLDESCQNMISKGKEEPTFLISSRSERTLEKYLRGDATKMIYRGASLSVGCLALLISSLWIFEKLALAEF